MKDDTSTLGPDFAGDNHHSTTEETSMLCAGGSLTNPERDTLEECESVILDHFFSFVDAGFALKTIRDRKLYRETHPSIEEYCQDRWGYCRQRAYQLIDAAIIASTIVDNVQDPVPVCERQVRPLAGLETDEEVIEAWMLAAKMAGGGDITGKLVKQAVSEVSRKEPRTNNLDQNLSSFCCLCERLEKTAAGLSPSDWDDNHKQRFKMALKPVLKIAVEAGILSETEDTNELDVDP